MAAGRIPAPGSDLGPCAEPCAHPDCAASRAQAASRCHNCGDAIGYDTRYYTLVTITTREGPDKRHYVHADCEEDSIQEEILERERRMFTANSGTLR